MTILISTVRIHGLRGLQNVEISLEPVTVLTGMNNSGKTSFLKALQIALGNRQFISHDDFYISGNTSVEAITVDLKIVPINDDGTLDDEFEDDWETVFTIDRIRQDDEGNSFIPLRTV
ncbi:MAG: AAA family ATPase, partial [Chloroflexota bacterium]|nr:AAA family ATPase [Chloroflexota bacterium]